jgi:hypothetical protein
VRSTVAPSWPSSAVQQTDLLSIHLKTHPARLPHGRSTLVEGIMRGSGVGAGAYMWGFFGPHSQPVCAWQIKAQGWGSEAGAGMCARACRCGCRASA